MQQYTPDRVIRALSLLNPLCQSLDDLVDEGVVDAILRIVVIFLVVRIPVIWVHAVNRVGLDDYLVRERCEIIDRSGLNAADRFFERFGGLG